MRSIFDSSLPPSYRFFLSRRVVCVVCACTAHAQRFSRGLDAAETDRFVGMYVNAFTVDYGPLGRRAVTELLRRGAAAGLLPRPAVDPAFVSAE